jgi:hypothetical protein
LIKSKDIFNLSMSTFTGKTIVGLLILLVITTCGSINSGFGGRGNQKGYGGNSFVV